MNVLQKALALQFSLTRGEHGTSRDMSHRRDVLQVACILYTDTFSPCFLRLLNELLFILVRTHTKATAGTLL